MIVGICEMLYFCRIDKECFRNCENSGKKKLSLISYKLLKYAVKFEYEISIPDEYIFVKNSFGKPYFNNMNIYFNISHCSKGIVCGVSNYEIGVDIQNIEPFFDEKLYNRVCCEEEMKNIMKSLESEKLFLRYWVLKESYIKCIGNSILNRKYYMDFSKYKNAHFELNNKKYSCFDVEENKIAVCSEGEFYYEYIHINFSDICQV